MKDEIGNRGRPPDLLLTHVLAVTALLLWLSIVDASAYGAARIRFHQPVWNFGAITTGDVAEHDYMFINDGTETLVILSVQASCGCTASSPSDDTIAPGETGLIHVTFNSSGKRGHIRKTVHVVSNDPEAASLDLEFRVNVKDPSDTTSSMRSSPSESGARAMMNEKSIFDSPCMTCHVIPGRAAFGRDLYLASCGMCHGDERHAPVHNAAAITGSNYLRFTSDDRVLASLAGGTGNPMMPGFHVDRGGPLSDSQIQSLMNYFREIRADVPIELLPSDDEAPVHAP